MKLPGSRRAAYPLFRARPGRMPAAWLVSLCLSIPPLQAAGPLIPAPSTLYASGAPSLSRTQGTPGTLSGAGVDPGSVIDDSWVRLAVVAASAKGLDGDQPLRYAYRDGERLGAMLSSVGQIEPANLILLKAEDREGFRSSLLAVGRRIAELKGRHRKVFLQFYYSGHGGAKRFHFSDGTLTFDEVKAALGGESADARVYVLDVCFGASFFNAKGFRTAPPVQLQMDMDQAARGEVTISSSSLDEQAYEVKNLGGSIFTSHWIMALRGAGDRNRDGQVTLFEAYNYAYDRTSGYSAETLDRPQHPSFQMDLTGARDVTLARLLRGGTGILFKGCPAGLYNVVDMQRGIQIGELRMPEGEEFTLALEPGRYRVVYVPSVPGKPGHGPAQSADLELANAAMATLPFTAFQSQVAEQALAKGSAFPGEEDADADPQGPEMRSAGLWTRMGYTAWGGAAGFSDAVLERNLNAQSGIDRYFGTTDGFRNRKSKPDFGIDLDFTVTGAWAIDLRFAFSALDYSLSSVGREPLNSLPDSARFRYPVNLSRSYSLSDSRVGAYLARNFWVTQAQGLSLEMGASLVSRDMRGERTLARPLYESVQSSTVDFTGEGVRVEAGLAYRVRVPQRWLGKGLALGFRLSPYFMRVADIYDAEGEDFSASEKGCTAVLSLGLLGRSQAAAPSRSPRRYP